MVHAAAAPTAIAAVLLCEQQLPRLVESLLHSMPHLRPQRSPAHQVQEMYAAALAEDPSAFAYDEVYEQLQEEREAPKALDKVQRAPKYIANLLEQAEMRKREQGISFERRLVRVAQIAHA